MLAVHMIFAIVAGSQSQRSWPEQLQQVCAVGDDPEAVPKHAKITREYITWSWTASHKSSSVERVIRVGS